MRKLLLLLVVVLALVSLGAASCIYIGEAEPPFEEPFAEPMSDEPPPGEPPPGEPQLFLTADRTSIQSGECITLEWGVEGGDFFGVELNGQPVDPFGHQQECPPESTVYILAVDIGEAMLHSELPVTVAGTAQPPQQPSQPSQPSSPGCAGPPMFTHFEANPSTITSGQSTLLEWGPVTNGATGPLVGSVILTPGSFGEVGSPGSRPVSPTTTTTYVLTATGCGGTATKSVTVTVNPPGGGGGWSGPPKVTNVTVTANPYTGPCPTTLVWTAAITVDGPCTVTYKWERHDGAITPVETLNFNAAGTKTVKSDWMVWTGTNATYWKRVRILTPLLMLSNQANLTFTCTP